MRKFYFISAIVLYSIFYSFLHADDDPCRGKNMLLNLVNRPSFSDSACTVPAKKLLIEGGAQDQKIIGGGSQINLPELNLRFGLSKNTEFVSIPPNYIHQTVSPISGNTPTWMAIKHRFYTNKKWIITGEAAVSPASGSRTFGSPHLEAALIGILFHQINKKLSWQVQMGLTELSDPAISGGNRYQSFNPNFLINYTFKDKISLYLEFFGQTKTSSTEAFGLIEGLGLVYLLNQKTTLDIEFYQRITGEILGFEHFVGAGITRLF